MRRVYNADHGDYVLCCKYPDRDKNDQWQVGFIDRVDFVYNEPLFIMQNKQRSYFKCCYLITKEEGDAILGSGDPSCVRCDGEIVVGDLNRDVTDNGMLVRAERLISSIRSIKCGCDDDIAYSMALEWLDDYAFRDKE